MILWFFRHKNLLFRVGIFLFPGGYLSIDIASCVVNVVTNTHDAAKLYSASVQRHDATDRWISMYNEFLSWDPDRRSQQLSQWCFPLCVCFLSGCLIVFTYERHRRSQLYHSVLMVSPLSTLLNSSSEIRLSWYDVVLQWEPSHIVCRSRISKNGFSTRSGCPTFPPPNLWTSSEQVRESPNQ